MQRGIHRVVVVLISSSVDPITPFFFMYDKHWNNKYRAIQKVKNNWWMKLHDQKDWTDTCAYQAEQYGEHNGECC